MTRLAPFALLRVAGVPFERLLRLAPPRTGRHVAHALAARTALAPLQRGLEELLHAAVPRIAPRDLRRCALALKRDVHNGRTPDAGLLDRVRPVLSPAEQASLDAWHSTQVRLSAELQAAGEALREEIETNVRGGLRDLLADELFLRALALAAPELCRRLLRERGRPPTGAGMSAADRSLLRYAVRAAAKTSPFSSFMHQGPVQVQPDDAGATCDPARAARRSRSTLNRGLLAAIHRAALVGHGGAPRPSFRVNSTVRAAGPGEIEALAAEYVAVEERTWRVESISSFRCPPPLVARLFERAGACVTRAELLEWIIAAGLDEDRAVPFLARLVERGVVWEAPWTDALDPRPEAGVVADVDEGLAEPVARMAEVAARFAEVEGSRRTAVLLELDAVVEAAFTAAGVEARIGRDNSVLEDGFLDGLEGGLGAHVCRGLAEVAELIRQRAVVAPEYAVMRERFVRTLGRGGRCLDVTRFLLDVLRQPASTAVRAPGGSARPVSATVFVQVASPLVVVNHVLDGIGWIGARHACGELGGQARLRTSLGTWLVGAMSPREPVDILGRGECNNLQQHPRLTRRILSWPSEPVRHGTPGVVPLERCSLVHDPQTDDLELRDPEDVPLAPLYLGGTIAGGFDLMNLLRLLAQPHHIPWPPPEPPPPQGVPLVHRPREVSGCVVTRRASWWVRSGHLRSSWFAHAGVRRLLDVAADREIHGIPELFFAQLDLPAEPDRFAALPARHRKPLWVDTRNPFCLELLERLALHGKWVVLREMLPGPADLSTEIAGQRFVSELHCEMVVEAA
ncbi:MAG TPA: hypothetical protein VFQ45_20035 [Longimicrobium sp.]|nr:hypothetical protein [Longimicrobium sp.]